MDIKISTQRIWKKKWVKCSIKIQNSGLKCNALGGKALRKPRLGRFWELERQSWTSSTLIKITNTQIIAFDDKFDCSITLKLSLKFPT
ncbi:hypothetical protein BpHYR1_026223 [Brachionus plicatilis]|uniref:Uncharacterized protein n=1 Tax=Brachionus plicatilis TaxID=10195 RepID=A0A3M7T3Q6_BRAPC|nr:hypothetical protein BpHYR1_026223 [Brachionus plicatilis]